MAITPVKDLVARAKSEIETLATDQVARMHAAEEILLVDIRDVRELKREGRIEGAMHAPRGMLEFWVDPDSKYHRAEFATDKPVVFFRASAWRSALAVKALQDIGYENAAEMDGGFSAWKDAGHPVQTG